MGEGSLRKKALEELRTDHERLKLRYQELLKQSEETNKFAAESAKLLVESESAFEQLLNLIPEDQMSEPQKNAKMVMEKIINYIKKQLQID
jgi:hypothetical protein